MSTLTDTLQKNRLKLSQEACEEYKYITPPAIDLSDIATIKTLMQLLRSLLFDQNMEVMEAVYGILSEQIHSKEKPAQELALEFIDRLPEIKRLLATDVKAVLDGDPAATNYSEVIVCYPAITAMLHYRVAHELLGMKIPLLPRIITELAHSATGIDIHPGAQIGEYFSIDHGTGVVIGETSIIGKHVRLYQGVTLGAKSFALDHNGLPINTPRHPILEDNVIIYSNATILGRITIGHDSIIGGNIWQIYSVPPFSRIVQQRASADFAEGLGI
ncbi:hypothetical protein FACS1894176_07760 [Bacteroidia bacterium]|nr:hypothetical protein FACS1894176_07760 [Bacteroidia bacterium]